MTAYKIDRWISFHRMLLLSCASLWHCEALLSGFSTVQRLLPLGQPLDVICQHRLNHDVLEELLMRHLRFLGNLIVNFLCQLSASRRYRVLFYHGFLPVCVCVCLVGHGCFLDPANLVCFDVHKFLLRLRSSEKKERKKLQWILNRRFEKVSLMDIDQRWKRFGKLICWNSLISSFPTPWTRYNAISHGFVTLFWKTLFSLL